MRLVLLLVAVFAIAATLYFTLSEPDVVEVPAPATEAPAESDVVEEAAEEAAEAAEDAATAAEDAVEDAAEAVEIAVEDAVEDANEAAASLVDQAAEAVGAAAGDAGFADVLTVDGFDYDKAVELVDGSDMGALQKTTLKTGLEQARDNPELLQQVLDQVRAAMGL